MIVRYHLMCLLVYFGFWIYQWDNSRNLFVFLSLHHSNAIIITAQKAEPYLLREQVIGPD
jgi:hypothetical protein